MDSCRLSSFRSVLLLGAMCSAVAAGLVLPSASDAATNGPIAFIGNTEQVCTMQPSGRHRDCITSRKGYDVDPAYSPTGRWIAFAHGQKGSRCGYRIEIVHPDGSGLPRLTCPTEHSGVNDRDPTFTPNGKAILFDRQHPADLFRMNLHGHRLRDITKTPGVTETNPTVNPRRPELAFMVWGSNGIQLFSSNLDGSNRQELTFPPDEGLEPDFSPNGRDIVYTHRVRVGTHVNDNVAVLRPNGSSKTLAGTKADEGEPSYSPDGRKIAYTHAGDVAIMDADGSHKRDITRGFDPSWGPR